MGGITRETLLSVDNGCAQKKTLKNSGRLKNTPVNETATITGNMVRTAGDKRDLNAETDAGPEIKIIKSYMIDAQCEARITLDQGTGRHSYVLIEPGLTKEERGLYSDIVKELHKKPKSELAVMKKVGGRERIRQKFDRLCGEKHVSGNLKEKMRYYIERDFWGYKKIDALLKDKNVEDVSCNGYSRPVYVYVPGFESIPTNVIFDSEEELDDFAMYLVQKGGKSISAANPIQDVALPDGSRLNGTIYREVSSNGTTFSIRAAGRAKGAAELLRRRTFTPSCLAYLWLAMENGCSMAFIGGTASGKTAALNAVSSLITERNKIVTIEDTREVRLSSQNWTPLVIRENSESPITEFDLLVAAFRQRPEYVIVGEVRTPEGARAAIHGINSGHTVLMTFHADSTVSFINRLTNEPFNISPHTASSLSLCINLAMVSIPSGDDEVKVRRCRSISEIRGVNSDGALDIHQVFQWDPASDEITMTPGRSVVLERIGEERGWSEDRIIEEIRNRTAIIRWIGENSVSDEDRIRKIVSAFNADRADLLRTLKVTFGAHERMCGS